jgi:hypothetical protein
MPPAKIVRTASAPPPTARSKHGATDATDAAAPPAAAGDVAAIAATNTSTAAVRIRPRSHTPPRRQTGDASPLAAFLSGGSSLKFTPGRTVETGIDDKTGDMVGVDENGELVERGHAEAESENGDDDEKKKQEPAADNGLAVTPAGPERLLVDPNAAAIAAGAAAQSGAQNGAQNGAAAAAQFGAQNGDAAAAAQSGAQSGTAAAAQHAAAPALDVYAYMPLHVREQARRDQAAMQQQHAAGAAAAAGAPQTRAGFGKKSFEFQAATAHLDNTKAFTAKIELQVLDKHEELMACAETTALPGKEPATGLVINANRVTNRGPQIDLIPGDIFTADATRTTIGGGVNGAYLVIANAVKVGFLPLLIPEQMPEVLRGAGHIPKGLLFWASQPIVFAVEHVVVQESKFAGSPPNARIVLQHPALPPHTTATAFVRASEVPAGLSVATVTLSRVAVFRADYNGQLTFNVKFFNKFSTLAYAIGPMAPPARPPIARQLNVMQ